MFEIFVYFFLLKRMDFVNLCVLLDSVNCLKEQVTK